MPTAEPLPDNIRRIAVLVASVDLATSRQLLLHLPTSVAKQVRRALQNLGPITAAERHRILTEFQSNAAARAQSSSDRPIATPSETSSSSAAQPHRPTSSSTPSLRPISLAEQIEGASPGQALDPTVAPSHTDLGPADAEHAGEASWKQLDARKLSHFLQGERPTIIAVLINQLPADAGVALLQHLPSAAHREILLAIANLQDIDAEALREIELHLAERLKDYELQVKSETKGTRRVAALLAAAPAELQETWARFVHIAVDPVAESPAAVGQSPASSLAMGAHPSTVTGVPPAASISPAATRSRTDARYDSLLDTPTDAPFNAAEPAGKDADAGDNHILPFPTHTQAEPLSALDRSLLQLEFEQLLSLSTQQLAQVLTAANSQTVLLALAGASPGFMKRFYSMLSKSDAKALASRLSQIGPLHLREIDSAQRAIAELAAERFAARESTTPIHRWPSMRVAA